MNITEEEWNQLEKFFLDQTGISMQEDILLLYHFTKNLKFKNILELGIGEEANSAKAFCYAISQSPEPKPTFTSIDIDENHIKQCMEILKGYGYDKYITPILSDSIEFLKNAPQKYYDCIFIDSSHEFQHTLDEIVWSSIKIKPEGYIFLHDTRKDGVGQAIFGFLSNNRYTYTEFNTVAGLGLILKKSYGDLIDKIYNLKGFAKKVESGSS